ncbi:hypothetical protein ALC56_02853, partial [Trachymyrmex septentrionalis]
GSGSICRYAIYKRRVPLKGEVRPIAPRGNKFTKCRRDKLSPAIYDITFP